MESTIYNAESPAYHSERKLFAWSLLSGLILFGALAGPFFAGRIYTRNDLGAYHLPVRAFYARQLAQGEQFDWMPQIFSGFYLTGEGQAGTYHPLHLFLYRFLPLRAAIDLECLLSYPLMLAGMWLFLRRRIMSSSAAMLGGVFFTFSSFNLLHFIHPNAVAVIAHIPWLLWTIDIVLLDARRIKVYCALTLSALLTGSQLLSGYPQYVWFSLLTESAYAVFVLIDSRISPHPNPLRAPTKGWSGEGTKCHAGAWPDLILAKFIGLFLGGVQLAPSIDGLVHSSRQTADALFPYAGSMHPLNLLQLAAPYLFVNRVVGQNTHELGLYLGVVPLLLIVWLIIRWSNVGRLKSISLAASLFGAVALMLSFGQYGRIYRLLTYLPLVGSFRFPARYVVIFQIMAALLAALGFLMLVRDNRYERRRKRMVHAFPDIAHQPLLSWRRCLPLWIVAAISVGAAVMGIALRGESYIAQFLLVIIGPVLFIAAALLIFKAARGSFAALVLLILLSAVDLGVYGLSYSVYSHCPRFDDYIAKINTPPGKIDSRVAASFYRFDEPGLRTGDQIIMRGWRRADGYAGLEPQRMLDYGNLPALRVAGVGWVRRGPKTNGIQGLIDGEHDWREVPDPLPRVRLVNRTMTSADPSGDIHKINVDSEVLTEVSLVFPSEKPGKATVVEDIAGRLDIRTQSPSEQLLVVSESYHPGWKAAVNGFPTQVYRVNGDYLGCIVGPGTQLVTLKFQPASLHTGRLISYLGLGFLPFCFAGIWLKP
jgi:hypothetical protein